LLDKVLENTRNVLQYMRQRFLWTWFSIGLLAVLTSFALYLATRNAETNLKQTDDIARIANQTADSAAKQADQTTAYLKGEQGIPGVPGANGVDGTPGQPSSVAGPPGPAGAKGDTGSPGANGTAGTAGATGPIGLSGASGPLGPVGPAGTAGANGTNGEAGAEGAQGPKGDKGNQGDKGDTGAQGPAGPAGPAGPQGAPGSLGVVNTTTFVAGSANDTTAVKQPTATCSAGKITGGGFITVPQDPRIVLTHSGPIGFTGWQVTLDGSQLPAGTVWQVLVFAICVTTQ
jgi:hypothetical protein